MFRMAGKDTMSEQGNGVPYVLTALRAATGERHGFLDRGMPLSKEMPTLLDYRDHLLTLKAWLNPLERWLAQFEDGPQTEEYLLRSERVALIDADLASLPPLPEDSRPGPDLAPSPPADNTSYRWGICYVIEGSQLGGAVLQKRLATLLAPYSLRYLSGDNTSPGPRWTRFVSIMDAEVRKESEISQACDGACHAFDRIIALHRGAA
jgi:heme oxygenase